MESQFKVLYQANLKVQAYLDVLTFLELIADG